MNDLKNTVLKNTLKTFQHNVVLEWNPNAGKVSKMMVPRVFSHDEITIDGYGKCIIELLTLHNTLIKYDNNKINKGWILSEY